MIGGAVGDAMGASVEFMSLAHIRQTYGKDGISDFE
jgi:ADP-ribosylglycohydrolase